MAENGSNARRASTDRELCGNDSRVPEESGQPKFGRREHNEVGLANKQHELVTDCR